MDETRCYHINSLDAENENSDRVCSCPRPEETCDDDTIRNSQSIGSGMLGSDSSITVHVHPTTGGHFELKTSAVETVDNLKKMISKKLKVPKDRICLLYREKHLRDGSLNNNFVVDGARIILLPSVEAGLLAQRPEQSVMQALESLSDTQVKDFLSGKAPLNLTMRLGDHMMLIQLQLSTVTPGSRAGVTASSSSSATTSSTTTSTPSSCSAPSPPSPHSTCSFLSSSSSATSSSSPLAPHAHATTSEHGIASSAPAATMTSTRTSLPPAPLSPQVASPASPLSPTFSGDSLSPPPSPVLDTRALAEASRNLTQTLRQLSSEVLTARPSDTSAQDSSKSHSSRTSSTTSSSTLGSSGSSSSSSTSSSSSSSSSTSRAHHHRKKRRGAIIESMHHHGRGVYSGTFSGSLNPLLQDGKGRPRRDISTIIHILNDLLCATPGGHYGGGSTGSTGSPQNRSRSGSPTATTFSSSTTSSSSSTTTEAPKDNVTGSTDAKETPTIPCQEDAVKMETDSISERIHRENQATRTKVERLRMILEERRERRRARRSAASSAPYNLSQAKGSKTGKTTSESVQVSA